MRTFSIFSISLSQFLSYTAADGLRWGDLGSLAEDGPIEMVLLLSADDGSSGQAAVDASASWADGTMSLVTLLQLAMLPLRFGLRVAPVASAGSRLKARMLLESSEVRSGVDALLYRSGCSCIWMAFKVFRTNWLRDMRVASSATWRSVLRRRSE